MLYRVSIFKAILRILDYIFPKKGRIFKLFHKKIKRELSLVNQHQFVYFTNHDDVATLNKVIQYIINNKSTRRVKIVAVLEEKNYLQQFNKRRGGVGQSLF